MERGWIDWLVKCLSLSRFTSKLVLYETVFVSFTFNVHGSVHRNNFLVHKSQQDVHVTVFILSDNCSTCFGRHYHPSSGAQNNCKYSIK